MEFIIKDRQQGKTTEMLKRMKDFLNSDKNNIALVYIDLSRNRYLKNRIKEIFQTKGDMKRISFVSNMNNTRGYDYYQGAKFFVDDFNFIPELKFKELDNAVYTATFEENTTMVYNNLAKQIVKTSPKLFLARRFIRKNFSHVLT